MHWEIFYSKKQIEATIFWRKITAIWKKFHAKSDKKIENIALHASIKISENFDINYPRWSKVASYNFVKNEFDHKRFFVSWRFAEQNSHWYKKCNGPKV